jgi:hypothetical protein
VRWAGPVLAHAPRVRSLRSSRPAFASTPALRADGPCERRCARWAGPVLAHAPRVRSLRSSRPAFASTPALRADAPPLSTRMPLAPASCRLVEGLAVIRPGFSHRASLPTRGTEPRAPVGGRLRGTQAPICRWERHGCGQARAAAGLSAPGGRPATTGRPGSRAILRSIAAGRRPAGTLTVAG